MLSQDVLREFHSAQEALIQASLGTSVSMAATAAAMRDQFSVFGANQNVMKRRVDDLTKDLCSRLAAVSKSIGSLKEGYSIPPPPSADDPTSQNHTTPVRRNTNRKRGASVNTSGRKSETTTPGRSGSPTRGRRRTPSVFGNTADRSAIINRLNQSMLLQNRGRGPASPVARKPVFTPATDRRTSTISTNSDDPAGTLRGSGSESQDDQGPGLLASRSSSRRFFGDNAPSPTNLFSSPLQSSFRGNRNT